MSILHHHRHHHHHHSLKGLHRPARHHNRFPLRVRCVTTAPPTPDLNVNQLTEPSGRAPKPGDPSLRSTWAQRAWVAGGCTTLAVSLAKCVAGAISSEAPLEPALAALAGYFLADLGSGVYHWGIDNYGSAATPVFGGQIDAFQGHHRWPWTITKRQFANNLHGLARVIFFIVLPIDLATSDPTLHGFVSMFAGCIMFSQQFHAWAHCTKSKLPAAVVALQDLGILVSRSQHADHHRPPYNNNYCIVSGVWNRLLDENRVLEALEMVLFFQLGARPRSWSEPSLEWTEDETLPSSNPGQ